MCRTIKRCKFWFFQILLIQTNFWSTLIIHDADGIWATIISLLRMNRARARRTVWIFINPFRSEYFIIDSFSSYTNNYYCCILCFLGDTFQKIHVQTRNDYHSHAKRFKTHSMHMIGIHYKDKPKKYLMSSYNSINVLASWDSSTT